MDIKKESKPYYNIELDDNERAWLVRMLKYVYEMYTTDETSIMVDNGDKIMLEKLFNRLNEV